MNMDVSETNEMAGDIVLQVNETKFKCQKDLLMDASDYFKGMFSSNMKESSSDLIELKEAKPEVIEVLVSSLTVDPYITEDNVYELLEGSVIYQFTDVIKLCCEFLEENLSHSNCLTIMCVADMFSIPELFNRAKIHSLWYFDDVAKESEVYDLSEDQFIEYLSHRDLNCSDELIVFELVCSWLRQNINEVLSEKCVENDNSAIKLNTNDQSVTFNCLHEDGNNNPTELTPATIFYNLLKKCVFLDMMCEKQLRKVLKHPLVGTNDEAKKLVMEAITKWKTAHREGKPVEVTERKSPRAIVCFGGHLCSSLPCEKPDQCEGTSVSRDVLTFSLDDCSFHVETLGTDANADWGENAFRMIGSQVTLVDKEVYVTGGEAVLGRNTWQYAVTIFNCITRRWRCGKDLRQPRRHHGACVMDNTKLFVIGGFGRYRKKMNSVESYDVKTETWTEHPPMLQAEFSPSVAVCKNSIYVFKTQIQRYKPDTKVWSLITIDQPISSNVSFALTFGKSIYLCCKISKSLRIFNPETNKCKEVGHFQKECKGCAVLYGKIYWFEDYSHSPTVECFDPRDKSFSTVGKLKDCVLEGDILTVPQYPTFYPSFLA